MLRRYDVQCISKYQSKRRILWCVHLCDPPARSDVVVGKRMHLCKHIFHHCLPHPRVNTNLGQVGSVGEIIRSTWWTNNMIYHFTKRLTPV